MGFSARTEVYSVDAKQIQRDRKHALIFAFPYFSLLIVATILVTMIYVEGSSGPEIFAPIIVALIGGMIILVYSLKKNVFAIYTNGISPPSKPWGMLLKRNVFIPYKDIINMELQEDIEATGDPEAHPFNFILTLRNGRRISINPIGGFGALGSYIKTEREMKKVYKLLKIVMNEFNREENILKRRRGEKIIIESSKFKT